MSLFRVDQTTAPHAHLLDGHEFQPLRRARDGMLGGRVQTKWTQVRLLYRWAVRHAARTNYRGGSHAAPKTRNGIGLAALRATRPPIGTLGQCVCGKLHCGQPREVEAINQIVAAATGERLGNERDGRDICDASQRRKEGKETDNLAYSVEGTNVSLRSIRTYLIFSIKESCLFSRCPRSLRSTAAPLPTDSFRFMVYVCMKPLFVHRCEDEVTRRRRRSS